MKGFGAKKLIEKTILFGWDTRDRGASVMLALLRESHVHYLHRGCHIGRCRNMEPTRAET